MLPAEFMAHLKSANVPTPSGRGFSMPAEWEPHEATWLAWPHNGTDWPGKLGAVQWIYGEMARKISAGEKIRLLVRGQTDENVARHVLRAAGVNLRKVLFVQHPTNRAWTRDSGPMFVKIAESGKRKAETAIIHFHFNGWSKYRDWQKDAKIPDTAARVLGKQLFSAQCRVAGSIRNFVIEGGGIEANGRGTLLTTEECYLHPTIQVRNPGITREQYDQLFRQYLGVKNIFWLAKGLAGDDTHGHVDDICRFVNSKTLVLVREKSSKDVNYRPLAENWECIRDLRLEDGSRPEVIELPMPSPLYFGGRRLPASYANFYICNAAVIVPTFNDLNDRLALGILSELFRDRPVIGIHSVDLVLGRGSLHCLTQQEPTEI